MMPYGGRYPSPGTAGRLLAVPYLPGTYDGVRSAAAAASFWDGFVGRVATINNSERYTSFVAGGAATPAFAADATDGLVYVALGSGVAALNDRHGIQFATFLPRAAENWGFKCVLSRRTAETGDLQLMAGLLADLTSSTTNGIYFRRESAASGWELVCRNVAETNTTLGLTISTTRTLLELRITRGGTKVQAYVNGQARGAPIGTNIPTGRLIPAFRAFATGTVTVEGEYDLWGWGLRSGM